MLSGLSIGFKELGKCGRKGFPVDAAPSLDLDSLLTRDLKIKRSTRCMLCD